MSEIDSDDVHASWLGAVITVDVRAIHVQKSSLALEIMTIGPMTKL